MGILIVALVDALISFFMYKMLERGNKVMAFVINILCLLCYYCLVNGFAHIFIYIIGSIVNGCLFGLIGIYIYNKETNLNRFLGTTVLLELIVSILTGLLIAAIIIQLKNPF